MNILALIPARMGSSRFPGKPMANILGKPMIGHVYERVSECKSLNMVAVATCDKIIFDYISSIGGLAVMTDAKHDRASDRCAEALIKIEKQYDQHFDIVVMIQGDEPMTHPDMISSALQPMIDDETINVVNLIGKISSKSEFEDRNCIKVVCNLKSEALYFSREPLPTQYKTINIPMGKQICVIPFRRNYLIQFNSLKPTPLEVIESIDMLRLLENGFKVHMVPTERSTHSVDTVEDLILVEQLMCKLNTN